VKQLVPFVDFSRPHSEEYVATIGNLSVHNLQVLISTLNIQIRCLLKERKTKELMKHSAFHQIKQSSGARLKAAIKFSSVKNTSGVILPITLVQNCSHVLIVAKDLFEGEFSMQRWEILLRVYAQVIYFVAISLRINHKRELLLHVSNVTPERANVIIISHAGLVSWLKGIVFEILRDIISGSLHNLDWISAQGSK